MSMNVIFSTVAQTN